MSVVCSVPMSPDPNHCECVQLAVLLQEVAPASPSCRIVTNTVTSLADDGSEGTLRLFQGDKPGGDMVHLVPQQGHNLLVIGRAEAKNFTTEAVFPLPGVFA
jgi:hypothetical protein